MTKIDKRTCAQLSLTFLGLAPYNLPEPPPDGEFYVFLKRRRKIVSSLLVLAGAGRAPSSSSDFRHLYEDDCGLSTAVLGAAPPFLHQSSIVRWQPFTRAELAADETHFLCKRLSFLSPPLAPRCAAGPPHPFRRLPLHLRRNPTSVRSSDSSGSLSRSSARVVCHHAPHCLRSARLCEHGNQDHRAPIRFCSSSRSRGGHLRRLLTSSILSSSAARPASTQLPTLACTQTCCWSTQTN